MTLNLLSKNMNTYNEKKTEFYNLVQSGASQDEQNVAFTEMFDALGENLEDNIAEEAQRIAYAKLDELNMQDSMKMSANELKFFNKLTEGVKTDVGFKEDTLLPQETVDKIFEDLTVNHEFLQYIGLKTTGLRLKFLKSKTDGVAVWGKIFSDIKGQLDASFSEESIEQSKLTAFVVIPKDLLEFGPNWVRQFVITQITEAFSVALEAAFINGSGVDQPIGLMRKVAKGVSISTETGYPVKETTGTLTLADAKTTVEEFTAIFKKLSVKENGKAANVAGNVILVANPVDAWDLKSRYTVLNAAGVYVTALPFGIKVAESEAVPAGKTVAFASTRYDAYTGGGVKIKEFDQTLALDDLELFVAKQFAYGKAEDDNVAVIYDLKLGVTAPAPKV